MSVSKSAEFVAEAKDHLAAVCDHLLHWERSSTDDATHRITSMLRAVHSIKGGAGFFGLRQVEQLAHLMESVLEAALAGFLPATSDSVDALLAATDRVAAMVDDADNSNAMEVGDITARLEALLRPAASESADRGEPVDRDLPSPKTPERLTPFPISLDLTASEQAGLPPLTLIERVLQRGDVVEGRLRFPSVDIRLAAPEGPIVWDATVASPLDPHDFLASLQLPSRDSLADAAPPATAGQSAPEPESTPSVAGRAASVVTGTSDRMPSIRIPVDLADRLVNLAGELVLVRNQSRRFAEAGQPLPASVVQRFDAVTREVQDSVLQTRMQPVGNLFSRFPRLVRDIGRQLEKQIELQIVGAEVEIDKSVLDAVSDPLTHLIRNACDHGLESAADRIAAGKSAAGHIQLTARHEGDRICIVVADDGRGIDRHAVRRRILEQGLCDPRELEQLPDQALLNYILLPGFSTAEQVTDLSGRGVGMDVVRTNLARLGGTVEIQSTIGQGTSIQLRLPLTLAIIPGMLVTARGQCFVIPQRDLEELVCVDPQQSRARLESTNSQEVIRLRERLIPLVRLSRVLQPTTGPSSESASHASSLTVLVAIVKAGAHRFGLAVDNILSSEEIVVKPMHRRLRGLTMYSGATILGDGTVALILSTEGIAAAAQVRFRSQTHAEDQGSQKAVEPEHDFLLLRQLDGDRVAVSVTCVRRVILVEGHQVDRLARGLYLPLEGVPRPLCILGSIGDESLLTGTMYAVLPRGGEHHEAYLARDVLGTQSISLQDIHPLPDVPAALGAALLGGRTIPILDLDKVPRTVSSGVPKARDHAATFARVLLVDDTKFFSDVVGSCLEKCGCEVTRAEDGQEALDVLQSESFDLVVSDLEMPILDGFGLATALRAIPKYRSTPLLALTTLSDEATRIRAAEHGFDALEVKFHEESFLARVRQLLANASDDPVAAEGSHV